MRRLASRDLHVADDIPSCGMGAAESEREKWEAFARYYSSKLPDRVASTAGVANRVADIARGIAQAPEKSAAEEPTT